MFRKPPSPPDPAQTAWPTMSVDCRNGHHHVCSGHRYVHRDHKTGDPVYGRCGCLCHAK